VRQHVWLLLATLSCLALAAFSSLSSENHALGLTPPGPAALPAAGQGSFELYWLVAAGLVLVLVGFLLVVRRGRS
jgi:bacteriorhodopsin